MASFLEDNFMNKGIIKRLKKEVKDAQISKSIEDMDYYSKLRDEFGDKYDISFIMNKDNAG